MTRCLRGTAVARSFAGLKALAGVDVEVEHGSIVGLIGPNGSGKTTLLNCLSGVLPPSSGRVEIEGVDVTGQASHRIARRGVSRTFQNIRLFAGMTVLENVEVGVSSAQSWGRAEGNRAVAAREVLAELGIADVDDRIATTLPYGIQRRVEIARALATRPDYLLLDEPAAGMNESESDDVLRLVAGIRESRGCGILIVDHDLRLIMRLCDSVQVLDQGRTIAFGAPKAVRRDTGVIAAYLGRSDGTETARA